MGQLVIFNASKTPIFVSLNGGDFFKVPAANLPSWEPAQPAIPPMFVNNLVANPGELRLGTNTLTTYASTSGPAYSGNCTLNIPTDVPIDSVQIYLFWKSATSVALIALQEGQPFQASIVTHDTASITTSTQPVQASAGLKAVQGASVREVQINM